MGATISVNGETGDDAWSGLCEEWDGGMCGPKATIQAGIDVAVDGDSVIVADGTYTGKGNRDISFGGQLITVRSANGPEACIINCQGSTSDPHRGFLFNNGETRAAVLDGVTITGGRIVDDNGAAIACVGSSPTIVNCALLDNTVSYGSGGGCYSKGGSLLVAGCRFDDCDNSSDGMWGAYAGGGVFCAGGTPELVGNYFTGCGAYVFCTGGGGAIAFGDTDIVIRGNTIASCGVHGAASGIYRSFR